MQAVKVNGFVMLAIKQFAIVKISFTSILVRICKWLTWHSHALSKLP